MGRPSKAELAARAAANAEDTAIEGADATELEEFQQPVPVVKADDPTPNGLVKVRVLPKGDGRVATGHWSREENAFTYHKKGEHLFLLASVAKAQEDNGLVEIVSGD